MCADLCDGMEFFGTQFGTEVSQALVDRVESYRVIGMFKIVVRRRPRATTSTHGRKKEGLATDCRHQNLRH